MDVKQIAQEISTSMSISYENAEYYVIDSFKNGVYNIDDIAAKIAKDIVSGMRFA